MNKFMESTVFTFKNKKIFQILSVLAIIHALIPSFSILKDL